MPTDVMSASCHTELFKRFNKKTCNAEVKSGFLVLLGPGGMRQDVRVIVYKTSLEYFAVIYPRKSLSKPIGVVNLKNTWVEQAKPDSGFIVRQKEYDNTISAKFLCPERDVLSWISAFTSSASPACEKSLPVLVEEESYEI